MSLAEAREKALEARKQLADGIDPQLAKEEQKQKPLLNKMRRSSLSLSNGRLRRKDK